MFSKSVLSTSFTLKGFLISFAHWLMEAIVLIPCQAAQGSLLLNCISVFSPYLLFSFPAPAERGFSYGGFPE